MKKSIRSYYAMLCVLLGLSISGILVLSYQAYNQAVSLLKKQFNDQQMLVAVQTAHGIEANIQSLVWQLEALTRMPGITDMDIEKARKSMGLVFEHVKEMVVNDIALVNSRGIVILPLLARDFAGANVSYREYFRQARNLRKQAPVYEYITFQGVEKGKKGIVIAMPFFDINGIFNGLVLFTIKADELIRRFIPLQNRETEYCVLESSGNILYHPVYKPGANIAEVSNMHISFRDFTNKIKDNNAYQGEYMSADGLRYIASVCPSNIVGRKWMIMTAVPEKTIRGLLAKFNSDYLFAMILLALTLAGGAGLTLKSQNKWNRSLQQEIRERKKAEETIGRQNEFLNTVIESIPYPFYVIEAGDHSIVTANSMAAPDLKWRGMTCYSLTHHRDSPCDAKDHSCPLEEVRQTLKPVVLEHVHFDKEGNRRSVEVHGYPIFDKNGNIIQMIEYAVDITARKKIEVEREHLIDELKKNLERVKLLSGLLPICASCKKIRDDKGYWNQIEAYIRDHSEADFSHGICPECAKKLYPDFYREKD